MEPTTLPRRPVVGNLDNVNRCAPSIWACLFMPWKWRQRALARLRRACLAQARAMGLRDPDAVIAAARELEAYLSGGSMTLLPEILTIGGIASDKDEACRAIQNGAVSVNGILVTDEQFIVARGDTIERAFKYHPPFCAPLVDGGAVEPRMPVRFKVADIPAVTAAARTLFIAPTNVPDYLTQFWVQLAGVMPVFARFARCCDVSRGSFFSATEWRFSPPGELPPECPLIDLPDLHQTFFAERR